MEIYIYTYCNMRMYVSYSVMNVTMNVVLVGMMVSITIVIRASSY